MPSFSDDDSHHPQLHQHPLLEHLGHNSEDIEDQSRNDANATSTLSSQNIYLRDDKSIWDLTKCPSRVACELGAFLSSSTQPVNFPQSLIKYLARKADNAEGKEIDNSIEDYEDEGVEKQIEKEQVFKSFVIALGKNWTQKQCAETYKCSILF